MSADDILKYYYFSQKIGFDISVGDNLDEESKPIFVGWGYVCVCVGGGGGGGG